MKKSYYQIDRRNSQGTLDGYEMIQAASAEDALKQYLGNDYDDYTITKARVDGLLVTTARCPEETEEYLEVMRAAQ